MSERTGQDWKGETSKAHVRRYNEGFYECYFHGKIIDIGCADDSVEDCLHRYFVYDKPRWTVDKWDYSLGNGDATLMEGVGDDTYDTVYASHVLEHLEKPVLALRNWMRILKPGGFLIVCVPEVDLYEKKHELPSRWNSDHKTYWNIGGSLMGHEKGIYSAATLAFRPNYIRSIRILDDGYDANGDGHPQGEYSIELIARKQAL